MLAVISGCDDECTRTDMVGTIEPAGSIRFDGHGELSEDKCVAILFISEGRRVEEFCAVDFIVYCEVNEGSEADARIGLICSNFVRASSY